MSISSDYARVSCGKSSDPESKDAWFDISTRCLSGFGCSVKFFPQWAYVLLLRHKTDQTMSLISIPHPKWERDLLEEFENWEIYQRFYEVENVKD